jgi:hypothetical protein
MKANHYFVRVQGTEVWIRILKVDFDALKKSGHRMEFTERPEGTYITIEQ